MSATGKRFKRLNEGAQSHLTTQNETVLLVQTSLLFITVLINDCPTKAFIDTGASVSVINRNKVDPDRVTTGRQVKVQGYDGHITSHNTWAEILLTYQQRVLSVQALVLSGVQYDFLLSRPDMKSLKLNLYWDDRVDVDPRVSSISHAFRIQEKDDIKELFPELVCPQGYPPAVTQFSVPFKLSDTAIVKQKPYPISREKKKWLEQEIDNMLQAGVIRRSTSPFASPVTIVPKEDGSLRLCTDYRKINSHTDLLPYPMPRIDDIINETGGSVCFSRIDLCKGFWQIPITEETKQYTAFTTFNGLFEYNRLPFGWKNSPGYFQKMMTEVLQPFLGKFCQVYIDDILVYSKCLSDHGDHLRQVLEALRAASLKVNFKKSEFFKERVTFLGRVFDGYTKTTKAESVARIKQLPKPHNLHSLRVFLGLAGHFRAFIKDYARKTKCLTTLTQKNAPFIWTPDCEAAYEYLVEAISSEPVLTIPDFQLPFELHTDASYCGTGSVLYQRNLSAPTKQQLRVIGFQSYTFTKPELNYSVTEKETLAVLVALRYFQPFLDGRRFRLVTDNSALTHLLQTARPRNRIARWILELQQYDFDVTHRPGQQLQDADALSRLPHNHAITGLSVLDVSEELDFKDGKYYVPPSLQAQVLSLYHDSPHSGGHDGFSRTYGKIKQRFTWPGMKARVKEYVRSCHTCQLAKAKFQPQPDVLTLPEHSSVPFEVIHLDFAEIKKKSDTNRKTQSFILSIDQCTRMVAARPGKESSHAIIALMSRDMFSNTKTIVSDNAMAFKSKMLQDWARQRGITLTYTSPYHPAGNGLAERAIRDVKQYLTLYPTFPGGWKCCLEAAVQHHNRTETAALGCSPRFAATGQLTLLPADVRLRIDEGIQLQEQRLTPKQERTYRESMKRSYDKRHPSRIPKLQAGDFVLVRKGLPGPSRQILGPFLVIRTAHKQGILKNIVYSGPSGEEECASASNVIPYHLRRDENQQGE